MLQYSDNRRQGEEDSDNRRQGEVDSDNRRQGEVDILQSEQVGRLLCLTGLWTFCSVRLHMPAEKPLTLNNISHRIVIDAERITHQYCHVTHQTTEPTAEVSRAILNTFSKHTNSPTVSCSKSAT